MNLYIKVSDWVQVNMFFVSAIIFMLSVIYFLHNKGVASRRQIPSISVALGIFFTFLGLSISLFSIAPGGIQQGTETLIRGLSTAFLTSVVGLFLSVCYRVYFASKEKTAIERMQSQAKQAQKIVNDFTLTIENGINNSTRQVLNSFNASLRKSLTEQVQQIESMTTKTRTHLVEVNSQIQSGKTEANKLTQYVSQSVTKAASSSSELLEVTNKLTQAAVEFSKLVEPALVQVKQVAELEPTAREAMSTITNLNNSTEVAISGLVDKLEKMLEALDTNKIKLVDNLSMYVSQFDSSYKAVVDKNLTSLDHTMKEGFDRLPNEFKEELSKTIQEYINVMKLSIDSHQAIAVDNKSNEEAGIV